MTTKQQTAAVEKDDEDMVSAKSHQGNDAAAEDQDAPEAPQVQDDDDVMVGEPTPTKKAAPRSKKQPSTLKKPKTAVLTPTAAQAAKAAATATAASGAAVVNPHPQGRGKAMAAVGKGKGKIASAAFVHQLRARRHSKAAKDCTGITRQAIRRIIRRGGGKRICGLIYQTYILEMQAYTKEVLQAAAQYTAHARRNTMSKDDVINGARLKNAHFYG